MRLRLSHGPLRTARNPLARSSRGQAGLTLIEFMVSIVIGMLMVAALATLIASQSATRTDLDKSGRMIENGRYAVQTLASDIQLAGYWGELTSQPAAPGALPDPCSVTLADLESAMGLHVQGYDAPTTLPVSLQACVSHHKPGTDVLVVRRVDPDTSATETGANTDLSKVVAGQIYLQTGLDAATGTSLMGIMATGSADPSVNDATFSLTKKDRTLRGKLRKLVVAVYYISRCSVPAGTSCTSGDGGTPVPTLKRVELGVSGGVPAFTTITIAEGIENLQVDYGVDTDTDGASNGSDVNGSALTVADWPNVMTMKVHLLARSNESTAGFVDAKSYALGTAGAASAAVGEQGYKRHIFIQSVRLVNPSGRRVL